MSFSPCWNTGWGVVSIEHDHWQRSWLHRCHCHWHPFLAYLHYMYPAMSAIFYFLPLSPICHQTGWSWLTLGSAGALLFLWPPCVIGQAIIFCPVVSIFLLSFFLSFFPRLISAAADWMSTILHTWCGLSVNLECRSETCCARLAANTGREKIAKSRHLGTIPQICRTISSLLRHVSTIGKKFC